MRGASKTPPKYRLHKRSGQAIVTLSGHDHYLGQHGSAESKAAYDRLICQWLVNGRKPIDLSEPEPEITVIEICASYWRHCKGYYVKDGKPTAEQDGIKAAIKRLKEEFGNLPASDLGPLKIQALQQRFVRDGVSRYYVNKSINRLKRMFRWAVSQELIPPSISQAIDSVTALKKGRTDAYELKPVPPVDDATVNVTLPRIASPITRDMVRIQRLTGMRPGELFVMKPKDIDRDGPEGCWLYHPERHKTEHHGQTRIVVIGPKAQDLLLKYLLKGENECCFLTERGVPYNRSNYRDRIRHACQMAFPAPKEMSGDEKKAWEKEHRWRPNQLRHSLATEVRKTHGLEAVQATLGHADMKTSQIYAERMMHLAVNAIKDVG